MNSIFITYLTALFLLFPAQAFSQQTFTVDIPGTDYYKYFTGSYYGGYHGSLPTGYNEGLATYRSYMTFSNISSYIPEGAEINSVKFFIAWTGNGATSAQIEYRDFDYGTGDHEEVYNNIASGTLWDKRPATQTEYSFTQLTDWVIDILNGTGVDPIRVGIKNQNESDYNYYVSSNSSIFLRVSYTLTTTVTQVDEQGSEFGQVGLWLGNDWNYINVPFSLNLQIGSDFGLQSDQNFKVSSYQKYWKWTQNSIDIFTNHHNFTAQTMADQLKSTFKTAFQGVEIKTNLENTGLTGGSVEFADPWLIDYPDPLFGNTKRNRGMKQTGDDALIFKTRTSSFYPDYSTNYNGDVYKGVFLNQQIESGKPYYSVGAPLTQEINLGGSLGTRNFYFY